MKNDYGILYTKYFWPVCKKKKKNLWLRAPPDPTAEFFMWGGRYSKFVSPNHGLIRKLSFTTTDPIRLSFS
jgi:hypothetical protein